MSKVVLVAGAEGFLGRAALQYLSRQGMLVAASCRRPEDAEKVQQLVESQQLKGAQTFVCDLAKEADVTRLVADVEARMGPVAAAFNAAGGFRWGKVDELTVSDYEFLMDANLRSSWLLAKALVPRFKSQGYGRLVFVSAKATLAPADAGVSLYVASKAGLNALVESLAKELKGTGATVNAILPSIIDTPANRQAMPDALFSDWVTTDELMQAAWTFLGPEGGAYNGALLPVTGRV